METYHIFTGRYKKTFIELNLFAGIGLPFIWCEKETHANYNGDMQAIERKWSPYTGIHSIVVSARLVCWNGKFSMANFHTDISDNDRFPSALAIFRCKLHIWSLTILWMAVWYDVESRVGIRSNQLVRLPSMTSWCFRVVRIWYWRGILAIYHAIWVWWICCMRLQWFHTWANRLMCYWWKRA